MKHRRVALVVALIGTVSTAAIFAPCAVSKDKSSSATTDSDKGANTSAEASASGATSSATTGDTSTSGSSSTLKGGVMSVAATAEKEVKEVGDTCRQLAGSIRNVFSEVQRQDQVVMSEPDVIGTMVIPAIPDASGLMSMGLLPPRKKWLDYFNYQVAKLIDILFEESKAVVLPTDASAQATADWEKIKDLVNQMVPVYKKMQSLSEGPKFDNMAIATQAQSLHDTVKEIEKMRKSVYGELKHEDKTRKKDTK